ncbi:hypothetical protein F5Y10DRAFT_242579 [Nemania abortiva]|nr:hypothetical protein F5Y10DRAFT_242579 [Nemania abortiva]
MSFPFNQLPPELRLEIWRFAVRADARRRRVVEQNFQVFPTLGLLPSPFFSVNTESRETALAFYSVHLEVYRQVPESGGPPSVEDVPRPLDYRGLIYLSPEVDDMVSVYRRAALYDSELSLERSERSRMTALYHRTRPMSETTRQLFRLYPDRWCLTRYASAHLGVQDWTEVHEWIEKFGEEEYRGACRLLRSMRIKSAGFALVFGWE